MYALWSFWHSVLDLRAKKANRTVKQFLDKVANLSLNNTFNVYKPSYLEWIGQRCLLPV